jgi:hypothetical protein
MEQRHRVRRGSVNRRSKCGRWGALDDGAKGARDDAPHVSSVSSAVRGALR